MPALTITDHSQENSTVIELDGDIDIATAEQFRERVMAAAGLPMAHVVLDCHKLAFIDSSGLRVLIQCHKAAKEHGSRIVVAAPSARVTQILHVTRLDSRIVVHPSVEGAVAAKQPL